MVTLETAVSGMGCFVICQKHIDILEKPVASIITIEEPTIRQKVPLEHPQGLTEYKASQSQRQQLHFNFNLLTMLHAELSKTEPLALHTYGMVLIQ